MLTGGTEMGLERTPVRSSTMREVRAPIPANATPFGPAQEEPNLAPDSLAGVGVPLAPSLLAVIEEAKQLFASNDSPLYTPNLLLALLNSPDNVAKRCFNRVEPNLADRVTRSLRSFIDGLKSSGFVAFDWSQREDIQAAQRLARRERVPQVTKKYLLLGMLETPSKTNTDLVNYLGKDKFEKLVRLVRETPTEWYERLITPDDSGNIFS